MTTNSKRIDYNSLSFYLLGSRSSLFGGVKFEYPFKTRDLCFYPLIWRENGCR